MEVELVSIPNEYKILVKYLCRALIKANVVNHALLGVVIGVMGSGKTNISLTLSKLYSLYYGGKCFYAPTISHDIFSKVSELSNDTNKVSIVLDDVSFKISKEFLNSLMRVRHILNKNVFVLLNCHYQRSIAPFLRSAPLRILTSISESEIRSYVSEYLFTTSSLWDYLHYYRKHFDKFIILMSVYGSEHILDVTNLTHDRLNMRCVEID